MVNSPSESISESTWRSHLVAGATSLVLAASLSSCAEFSSSPTEVTTVRTEVTVTPSQAAEATATSTTPIENKFKRITIVELVRDQPNAWGKYGYNTLSQYTAAVSDNLSAATGGKIQLAKTPRLMTQLLDPSEKIKPTESNDFGLQGHPDCYTDTDIIKSYFKAVSDMSPGDRGTEVALVLEGARSCSGNDSRAAWSVKDFPLTVYNQNIDVHEMTHELGHQLGLTHDTIFYCGDPTDDKIGTGQYARFDIGTLLKSTNCTVAKNADGSINEYADNSSAMGSEWINAKGEDAYNFVEINQLNPDIANIATVGTQPAEYTLGMKSGELRGVSIELPKDHPLHKLDPSISRVVFGLQQDFFTGTAPESHLVAYAVGDSEKYKLLTVTPLRQFMPGTREAYVDMTLGIQIDVVAKGSNIILEVATPDTLLR